MKNLVYYSISNQTVYAEMLKLSIQTIDESNDDFIDILVITDELFYQNNLSDIKRPNLFFHFVIFDYKYNKIILKLSKSSNFINSQIYCLYSCSL